MFLLGTKHLHALVYIVADAPVKDNIRADIPLVGTQSYKTLLMWLGEMNVDISRVRMYNQSDKPFDHVMSKVTLNKAVELGQIKVIALGHKAASYLNRTGIEEYYLLPHPSLRNRQLNDAAFIKDKLESCRGYIYGQNKTEENIKAEDPNPDSAESSFREQEELPEG